MSAAASKTLNDSKHNSLNLIANEWTNGTSTTALTTTSISRIPKANGFGNVSSVAAFSWLVANLTHGNMLAVARTGIM